MLTLDIRHIHYTAILHALSTAACRHAERAKEAQADDLYRVARMVNDIGIYIQNTHIETILNSPIPLPTSIAPIVEDDTAESHILSALHQAPNGLTNAQLTEQLDYDLTTIRQATSQLVKDNKLTYTLNGQTRIYTIPILTAAAPAPVAAPAPAAAPAPEPIAVTTPDTPPTISNLIIQCLRTTAPLTGQQIAEYVEVDTSTIYKHIKTLTEADIVRRANNRTPYTYALAAKVTKPSHPAITGRDGAADRIIYALIDAGSAGLTGLELADAIQYSYQVTQSTLSRLAKDGHIHRSTGRPTRYTLATEQAHAQAAD